MIISSDKQSAIVRYKLTGVRYKCVDIRTEAAYIIQVPFKYNK